MLLTEAMALFRGEFDFSSTMDAIDSTEETRLWGPNGRVGASKNGSGACFWSLAIVRLALSRKFPNSGCPVAPLCEKESPSASDMLLLIENRCWPSIMRGGACRKGSPPGVR